MIQNKEELKTLVKETIQEVLIGNPELNINSEAAQDLLVEELWVKYRDKFIFQQPHDVEQFYQNEDAVYDHHVLCSANRRKPMDTRGEGCCCKMLYKKDVEIYNTMPPGSSSFSC